VDERVGNDGDSTTTDAVVDLDVGDACVQQAASPPRAEITVAEPVVERAPGHPISSPGGEGGADAGVTLAELNLKLIGDVISQIRTGQSGYAYVVDANRRLIALPDIDLVLRQTDLSTLPQVSEAVQNRTGTSQAGSALSVRNLQGDSVLAAYEVIEPAGWWVFVEEPLAAAFRPLYASLERSYGGFADGEGKAGESAGTSSCQTQLSPRAGNCRPRRAMAP
jgi:two-component system, NtrC family, sensor kinase